MSEHAWVEECLHDLGSRYVVAVVATSSFFEAIFCEPLVGLAEPLRSSGIVREEEPQEESTRKGDAAFDYEEPPEAFQPGGAIDVTYSISDCASKCACQVAESCDEGDADSPLVESVPDCDEVNNP